MVYDFLECEMPTMNVFQISIRLVQLHDLMSTVNINPWICVRVSIVRCVTGTRNFGGSGVT